MAGPEAVIERYLQRHCKEAGILCWKFISPSNAGVPDRVLMFNGRVVFVELKAPGKKPRPLQVQRHEEMRARGIDVRVIDNRPDCLALIDELLNGTEPEPPTSPAAAAAAA